MKTHSGEVLPKTEVIGSTIRMHFNEVVTVNTNYTDHCYDTVSVILPESPNLDQIKDAYKTLFRGIYDILSNGNVVVGSGLTAVTYQGGFDSAIKLDAAKRLSEVAGLTSVTFFDIYNKPHTLAIPDATTVILSVATAFQSSISRKQTAMVAVDQAVDAAGISAVVY